VVKRKEKKMQKKRKKLMFLVILGREIKKTLFISHPSLYHLSPLERRVREDREIKKYIIISLYKIIKIYKKIIKNNNIYISPFIPPFLSTSSLYCFFLYIFLFMFCEVYFLIHIF